MTNRPPLDVRRLRQDFPLLAADPSLHYLDSAASSQTPVQVLEAMDNYYRHFRANVHRGMYRASETASVRFEEVRRKAADLIGAHEEEIVFTRGTTESLNVLAIALTRKLGPGDEVCLSALEHHANLVPWQMAAKVRGFALKVLPLDTEGRLDLEAARTLIGPRTKVVSVAHVSNVLGTIVPVQEVAALAHAQGALCVVDAAQSVGHLPIDVRRLEIDFLAFSGHKALGPTGTGVLWGRKSLLDGLEPVFYGGDMIQEVFWDRATWNETPWKFEAGTPDVGGIIGLGAACDYLRLVGVEVIRRHELELLAYALDKLRAVPGVKLLGPARAEERSGAISFSVAGVHPHDLATVLDTENVAIRAGHHCAMPLLRDLGLIEGTARASLHLYSVPEDIDALITGIAKAQKIFRV